MAQSNLILIFFERPTGIDPLIQHFSEFCIMFMGRGEAKLQNSQTLTLYSKLLHIFRTTLYSLTDKQRRGLLIGYVILISTIYCSDFNIDGDHKQVLC